MQPQRLLANAIFAAYQAGQAILEIYQDPQTVEIWQKPDQSPLTTADKAAHETIVAHLEALEIPILSEEGRDIPWTERQTWDRFWLVDPLDGTKEFIKRNGEFTVNIALIEGQQPVIGVIYAPVKGAFFIAIAGKGSYRLTEAAVKGLVVLVPGFDADEMMAAVMAASQKLTPRPPDTQEIMIVGSRSHMSPEVEQYVDAQRKNYPRVTFKAAGSSLKLCLVAAGQADVYPRFGPTMEWDIAAGHIIAQEAGLKVWRYPEGVPLAYNKENLLNPWFAVFSDPYTTTLFPEG